MTATAEELFNSHVFWKKRLDEQEKYITNFKWGESRTARQDIFQSAIDMLNEIQYWYFATKIVDEMGGVVENRILIMALAFHNETFQEMRKIERGIPNQND